MSWTAADMLQAECRIRRHGAAKNLLYEYILCKETWDGKVFAKLKSKAYQDQVLIDGGKDYGDMKFNKILGASSQIFS